MPPLTWIEDELANLERAHLRRLRRARLGPQSPAEVALANDVGDASSAGLMNFGSNDYLGLASDPRLRRAVTEALINASWGAGASPLVTGRGMLHRELEQRLANFKTTEAAILFSSGFAANVGVISAVVGQGDCIFSDAKNHASIIDGCRLSGAKTIVYRHCDVDDLKSRLTEASEFRRRLIVTDSVFSMDGDIAPIAKIAELAEESNSMLMIDEAHATGVFGKRGSGVAELQDAEAGVPIRVGTLSKALGSAGGFVAGSQPLIDWLANRARSYVFSTAFPDAFCAAGIAALDIITAEPATRETLLATATGLRNEWRSAGFDVGDSASQIIPIYLQNPEAVMQATELLRDQGVFAPGIRPPSVPPGECLLRVSLSAAHTEEHTQRLTTALKHVLN